jgi:hypothetical protein
MKLLARTLAALSLAVVAFGQQLTDDQVRLAIERGVGKRHQIGLTLNDKQTAFFSTLACRTCGQSGYTITVYNPEQWIELVAAQAKKEMQPFSVADVTDQMRAQELHVVALPSQAEYLTGNGIALSSSVHRVVLNDTTRQTTIQPLAVRQDTLQSNSALRSFEYTMASAEFSLEDVERIRGSDPKGEFFIVVVGDNQNKFFKVKSRDFKRLFSINDKERDAGPDRHSSAARVTVKPITAPPSTGPGDGTVAPVRPTPVPATVTLAATAQIPVAGAEKGRASEPTTTIAGDTTTRLTLSSPTIPPGVAVEEVLLGISCTGAPTVRHDGIEISFVQPKGPADNLDIKPGDIILAIDGHFLYTIDELRAELLRHEPGKQVKIRYRHYQLTSENYLTIGDKDAVPTK